VSLDQPLMVIAACELDRLAQILNVLVKTRPQTLLLERSDEPFGASVAGGSPANAGLSSIPSHAMAPWKWPEMYWGPSRGAARCLEQRPCRLSRSDP
jgi:hypothetical protein